MRWLRSRVCRSPGTTGFEGTRAALIAVALSVATTPLPGCRDKGPSQQPVQSPPNDANPPVSDGLERDAAVARQVPRADAAPKAPPFAGTAGIIDKLDAGPTPPPVVVLKDVRSARHDGFDRVVFEFSGDRLPGYHLEYIDYPVRRCGSGDPTEIAGQGFLEVRMTPVNAHTEAGKPTIADRERRLDLPALQELELTCDFEAIVTWVLGAKSPNKYRALELSAPPRLVVDVLH